MLYQKTFQTILGNITAIEEDSAIIALQIKENSYRKTHLF